MMKKLTLVFILLLVFVAVSSLVVGQQFTEYSETTCQGNVCEATIYQTPRYWVNSSGDWNEIQEAFKRSTSNVCSVGFSGCVPGNLYQVNVDEVNDLMQVVKDGHKIDIKPISLEYDVGGLTQEIGNYNAGLALVGGNVIEYTNSFNMTGRVNLRFGYLSDKLKVELKIFEPSNLPPVALFDKPLFKDLSKEERKRIKKEERKKEKEKEDDKDDDDDEGEREIEVEVKECRTILLPYLR